MVGVELLGCVPSNVMRDNELSSRMMRTPTVQSKNFIVVDGQQVPFENLRTAR